MKPHDKIAGWLVDDDGNIFTRVREFTCRFHPHGPPDVDDDDPLVKVAIAVFEELGSNEAVRTVTHLTPEDVLDASEALGICCRGHRWRDTGELREVGAMEMFMRLNLSGKVFDNSNILLAEINRAGADSNWQGVRIPLIVSVHREGAGPQEILPNRYNLDPAKPPTVE